MSKIVVGLSGGVDSSVAAYILKCQGHEVTGLFMKNWHDTTGVLKGDCAWDQDVLFAELVARKLEIPFHTVDLSAEYRKRVVDYLFTEYEKGRTPNPDVLCNREIKFGVFRMHARRLGGDAMATGHYARTARVDGRTYLEKALDRSKDQSYFLHAVTETALAETVFPLGDLSKSEVRSIAREHGLEVHDKKDSTGICFIGERPFREFLATYLSARPGPIRTPDGVVVGEHHGLAYYTLGQRQGLGIGGRAGFGEAPWYVAAKDAPQNALIVVQGDDPLRFSEALLATSAHWINGEPASLAAGAALSCNAKLRYRQTDRPCEVRKGADGQLAVAFPERQADVTPGQYIVFYAGDRCLGGAVIERTIRRPEALLKTG